MGSRRYPLDVDGNPIYFVDENGDTVSSGKDIAGYSYAGVGFDPFRTSSLIINAWSGKDGTPFDYSTGSALDASGTGKGASDMTFAEGAYDPDNLEIRQMNLSRAGFSVMNFNARLYSKMYDQLAKLTIPGYQAMYDDPTELDNTTFSSEQNGLVSNAATLLNTALDGLKFGKRSLMTSRAVARPSRMTSSPRKTRMPARPMENRLRTRLARAPTSFPLSRSCSSLQEPEPLPVR